MISMEMLVESRAAVEELAAGTGCPTVLMKLVDRLEELQRAGREEVSNDVPNPGL